MTTMILNVSNTYLHSIKETLILLIECFPKRVECDHTGTEHLLAVKIEGSSSENSNLLV